MGPECCTVDAFERNLEDDCTRVEKHALVLAEVFPDAVVSRTRDVIQFDIDHDRGCTVILTAEAAEIRLPTIEWTKGAYGPRPTSRPWKRISLRGHGAGRRVLNCINAAISARTSEFRECVICKCSVPPEHRVRDYCHGCASSHLGIVF